MLAGLRRSQFLVKSFTLRRPCVWREWMQLIAFFVGDTENNKWLDLEWVSMYKVNIDIGGELTRAANVISTALRQSPARYCEVSSTTWGQTHTIFRRRRLTIRRTPKLLPTSLHSLLIPLRRDIQHRRNHPPQQRRKPKPNQRLQHPNPIPKPNTRKRKHCAPFIHHQ